MRPKRSRKTPLSVSRSKNAVTHHATQSTISSFHTLLKRQARLKCQLADPSSVIRHQQLAEELRDIEADILAKGGIEAYQVASTYGQSEQRGGNSAKVLINWLKLLRRSNDDRAHTPSPSNSPNKLRVLELGALTPDNFSSCGSWISNTPIDLHSRHPHIVEQDFFNRPMPKKDAERFNVISCSLVLNFVPEADQRGRMLYLIHEHLVPSEESLLFLVLPSPCIRNSRYISPLSLRAIMQSVGFELLRERYREGGKVTAWLFGWRKRPIDVDQRWSSKVLESDGPKRNNFAILLPHGQGAG